MLKKGVDPTKDQSYVLYHLTQAQLAHTLFPLGSMQKSQTREIAAQLGFGNAQKQDSQDICFVPQGNYAAFIQQYTQKQYPPGDFITTDGHVLGQHKGIIHYTIGQRRGLLPNLSQIMYVVAIDPQQNTITLGTEQDLYRSSLIAQDINLISVLQISRPMHVTAKIRYNQQAEPATVFPVDENTLRVEFAQPQKAVTPGQAVVFYDGDIVVGGGTIQA